MENDLISIIVPIYNVEKYLNKCIDSIINQTYKNLEIILVDDGSPDNCGKICDEYAEKDSRIRVIHKENGGLSDARNAGLEIATGKYIGFIDSDDYISPEMYEALHRRINEDKSDMAVCPLLYVDESGKTTNNRSNTRVFTDKIYYKESYLMELYNYVTSVNKLYKRFLWNNIRFPYGKLNEDAFVEYKVVGECSSISFISKPMYYYVQRNGSIMNSEFSVRRLDAAEAYIGRIEYLLSQNIFSAIENAVYYTLSVLGNGYRYLNLKEEINSKRINELRKKLKKLYFKIIFNKMSIKTRIHLTVFLLNPKLYLEIIKCYTVIKRKLKRSVSNQ